MPTRTRLAPDDRRTQLIATAARSFAAHPYDEVRMDQVAAQAEVSRGLLYRYFPTKRDLFAAVYRRAVVDLLDQSRFDPEGDLTDQIGAGLDAHLDYFEANRHAVMAANRTFAGDPVIQTVINDELVELRDRLIEAVGLSGHSRDLAAAAVLAWLTFIRTLCLEWLTTDTISRDDVRQMCLRTLHGVLGADLDTG